VIQKYMEITQAESMLDLVVGVQRSNEEAELIALNFTWEVDLTPNLYTTSPPFSIEGLSFQAIIWTHPGGKSIEIALKHASSILPAHYNG
jgi:hypothetical protein